MIEINIDADRAGGQISHASSKAKTLRRLRSYLKLLGE